MLSRNVNVRELYFQHRTLTPIIGRPTYASLQTLLVQLKANAHAVPTTLGGGQHGHLGLILSDARYALVAPNTPFMHPPNPGDFIAPPAGTAAQIDATRQTWTDQHNLFDLKVSTEQALIPQVLSLIHI